MNEPIFYVHCQVHPMRDEIVSRPMLIQVIVGKMGIEVIFLGNQNLRSVIANVCLIMLGTVFTVEQF